MLDFFSLAGPSFGPVAGGDPEQLVILLHGLGADGDDLIELAPEWARMGLSRARFVSPHAPFPCDMAPYGRQWFSLQDRGPESLLAGVQAAAPILDAFIDAELERHGLGDDRLVLVGFSQGTMMSLHVAPRRPEGCAAVLGYSGALIGAGRLPQEARSRPPVLLVHGDADEIVPIQALAAAASGLAAARIPVTTERRPGLGHSIDERGLHLGAAFIVRSLARPRSAGSGDTDR